MVIIFGVWVSYTSIAEHQQNPAVAAAGVHSNVGNTEGKEVALRRHHDRPFRGGIDEHLDRIGRRLL